jgi:carbamoyl-phosphate synthase large subunit
MTTVLVTGVGAVTGYGLLRDLRQRRPEVRLVGTDIHGDAVGAHWCDRFVSCPPALDASYGDWLWRTVREEIVDLVLPTLDADLDFFLAAGVSSDAAAVALNSGTALRVSRDKLELDRRLVAHEEPARIETSTSRDFDVLEASLGVPFLLKPRRGYGSRGIVAINDRDELASFVPRLGSDLIAQQIVGRPDDEYTLGAFGDGRGRFGARILMRRTLAPWGATRRVEVLEVPPDLDATIDRLAAIVEPRGPTNLQFRRDESGWRLLEVNARVSSSSSLRALFGYHDAEMTLDFYLHDVVPPQPDVRLGTAARYFEDLVTT